MILFQPAHQDAFTPHPRASRRPLVQKRVVESRRLNPRKLFLDFLFSSSKQTKKPLVSSLFSPSHWTLYHRGFGDMEGDEQKRPTPTGSTESCPFRQLPTK